jgi:hypothetical protein
MNYDIITLLYKHLPQRDWSNLALLNKTTYEDYKLLKLPKLVEDFIIAIDNEDIEDIKYSLKNKEEQLLKIYKKTVASRKFYNFNINILNRALDFVKSEIINYMIKLDNNYLIIAFEKAVRLNKDHLVKSFLKQEFSADILSSALSIACNKNYLNLTKLLIDNGAIPIQHINFYCYCVERKSYCLLL